MDKLTFDQDFEDKYYSGKKKNSSKSLVVAVVILILIGLGICGVLLKQYLGPAPKEGKSQNVSVQTTNTQIASTNPISTGLSDITVPDVLTLPELEVIEEPEPIVVTQEPISEVLVQFLNIPATEPPVVPEPISEETTDEQIVVEPVIEQIPEIVATEPVPEPIVESVVDTSILSLSEIIELPEIVETVTPVEQSQVIPEPVEEIPVPVDPVVPIIKLNKKGIITDLNLVKDFKKANKK